MRPSRRASTAVPLPRSPLNETRSSAEDPLMHPKVEMPAGLRRARRTAAAARASLAASGIIVAIDEAHLMHKHRPVLVLIGFGIIFVTALVQLLAPRAEWI